MVALVVIARLAVTRSISLSPKYVLLGILVGLHILLGVIINAVPPGAIVFGIRPYLKWVPIFLIPVVYQLSQGDLKELLKFILMMALLQCPFAIFQRFIQYKDISTGDVITGTLGENASGALSIFMVSAIALLIAFYVRKRIRFSQVMVLVSLLFIPTTINETKVTLILLPLALVVPYIFSVRKIKPIQLIGIPVLALMLTIGFVAIYDQVASKWGGLSVGFFVDKQAETYMYRGDDRHDDVELSPRRIGKNLLLPKEIITLEEGGGRIDKILLPINVLSNDSVKLWVGLGVGNAMLSSVSISSGSYGWRLGIISNDTLMSFLLWETGIGGLLLFLIFMLLVTYDAYKLARTDDIRGAMAAGWLGVLVIIFLSIPYTNIFYFSVLIYLFALLSGMVAAEAARIKRIQRIHSNHES